MAKSLRLLHEAVEEMQQAHAWYGGRSAQASRRLEVEIERSLASLQSHPDHFPVYLLGTRYCQLRRFPYLIVFCETDDAVEVLAFAHSFAGKVIGRNA